ncbi:hypothetical protein NQ042_05045 [Corynebacterium phoceense]|uniref:hypothetical protein n=1 Tax=Corynebacterium phoceense TaxID=1686286 RepID=UPI00211BB595|nr:hypothetical protein [Corynebacterium phoceense]MCQ9333462.1 hypothetical protein [Corynebacterium phoceense]
MEFTIDEYFATYDDALAKLAETVETQQNLIEALFHAVNDARVAANQQPLKWQEIAAGRNEGK